MTAIRPMEKKDLLHWGIVCAALLVITLVHYGASVHEMFWHEIFQRAYYLPIIAAALWYGLRGGLLSAALAAILYIPHIFMAWHQMPSYQFNQYSEVVLFFVFGGLTGVLADQQKRQRDKLQSTAQQLSEANAELQKSFESLRRAERLSALGRLSAGLAHEIRNPLSAIGGALNIIARPGLEIAQRDQFIADIKKEVLQLNTLLTHFLEFARPHPPQLRPTGVGKLLDEVCGLVSGLSRARNVNVHCVPFTEHCVVNLDASQIKQVILNLIINAGEAMPEGGSVELGARTEAENLVIYIKDEGVGIPENELQQIFDPFYTTKPEGTGLGLSIGHQIVEQQGGNIEVRRNLERGMTFELVFPLPVPAPEPTPAGESR
jgi:two-component system sensor histidine kinase HydH